METLKPPSPQAPRSPSPQALKPSSPSTILAGRFRAAPPNCLIDINDATMYFRDTSVDTMTRRPAWL